MSRTHSWAAFLALAALTLAVYAPGLSNGFSCDDASVLTANPFVHSAGSLPKLFSREYLASKDELNGDRTLNSSGELTYRPVTTFSYFVLYALFGDSPRGYHAASLLLHAVNAWLVFLFVFEWTRRRPLAWLAAVLFMAHPVQAEAVSVVTYNEDLLAFFFSMLSALLWLRGRAVTSAVFYALACFSKESAVVLPLLLALAAPAPAKKFAPHAALFGLYALVRFGWMSGPDSFVSSGDGTFMTVPVVFARYVLWLLFPWTVGPTLPDDRTLVAGSWAEKDVLLSLGFLAAVFLGARLQRKKRPLVFAGLAWYGLAWLPLLAVSQNHMAPRYLYLPVFGLCLAAAEGLSLLTKNSLRAAALLSAVSLVVLGGVSSQVCRLYKDDVTLRGHLAARMPSSPDAHSALADALRAQGRMKEAEREYRTAMAMAPGWYKDELGLAESLLAQRRLDEARPHIQRTLALRPGHARGYVLLGYLEGKRGRHAEALMAFEAALKTDPRSKDALSGLAAAYSNLGRPEESRRALERARALK